MGSSDVDKLLESYLSSDESNKNLTGKNLTGKNLTGKNLTSKNLTGPAFPTASSPPPPTDLSNDLDALLARYLETTAATTPGENDSPSFTLPRKTEIDEMLRDYRRDKSPERSSALRRGLADHVDAVDSTRRAVGSTIEEDRSASNMTWQKRSASDIHRQHELSEKLALYAQALEDEEAAFLDESSEDLYAFDPTGSTIQGMPPGDAPRSSLGKDKK